MKPFFYILNPDHTVEPAVSGSDWRVLRLFEVTKERIVAQDSLSGYFVSTVFLVIDHGIDAETPILFETMVFDANGKGVEQKRYCTWDEAISGHQEALESVKGKIKEDKIDFNMLPKRRFRL